MEVSGQLHILANLPLGKQPVVPTGYEAGWAGPRAGLKVVARRKIPSPPLPGIEPQSSGL